MNLPAEFLVGNRWCRSVDEVFMMTRARQVRIGVVGFVCLYVLSRLPFLPLGFGNEFDAWSMASNAADLLRGVYRGSRLPGHPIYEGLYSVAVVFGGPLLSNTLTMVFSLGLLGVVILLGRALRIAESGWAAIALAVHPLFWVKSADSSDFVLAALFGTSSVLAAVHSRSCLSGALLGLAMGTRAETGLFVIPVLILGRGLRRTHVITVTLLVTALSFIPVALWARHERLQVRDWFLRDHLHLLGYGMNLWERLLGCASMIWGGWGLVSLVVLAGLLVSARKRLVSSIRGRDPLVLGVAFLSLGYLSVAVVDPTRAAYYVPLLPLVLLAIAHVARAGWRLLLVIALMVYAIVYPDVVDRAEDGIRIGFRWNNGIVVKEWIARWNTVHAASAIEQNRPKGESVVILGYWLSIWRYYHSDAMSGTVLPGGLVVDITSNRAYQTSDGAWIVHNLDRGAAAKLSTMGIRLAYGEGIDNFLRETQGFNVRDFGAAELAIRNLGSDVSEHFTVPLLLRCGLPDRAWTACVEARRPSGMKRSGSERR